METKVRSTEPFPKYAPDIEGLKDDLAQVLNKHCYENLSNTPDFILADYLVTCLVAWNSASTWRETWYGYQLIPGQGGPTPIAPPTETGE